MTRPASEPSPFEVFKMSLLICPLLGVGIVAVLAIMWVLA